MADFYRDVIRLLRNAGFEQVPRRGKGSHEIWRRPDTPPAVTVPRKLRSRMTANAILKAAGQSKRF
jgi:predicted RNA binding protein YcfA (HicA-like mRNA interferase family)